MYQATKAAVMNDFSAKGSRNFPNELDVRQRVKVSILLHFNSIHRLPLSNNQ